MDGNKVSKKCHCWTFDVKGWITIFRRHIKRAKTIPHEKDNDDLIKLVEGIKDNNEPL